MTTLTASPTIDALSRSTPPGVLLALALIPAFTLLILLVSKEVVVNSPDQTLVSRARAWDIALVPLGFTVCWIVGSALSQVLS